MDEKRVEELFADQAFVKSLLEKLETPEQVQTALKGKGVELSLEEIVSFGKALREAAEDDGELSDGKLENVAGGFIDVIHERVRQQPGCPIDPRVLQFILEDIKKITDGYQSY